MKSRKPLIWKVIKRSDINLPVCYGLIGNLPFFQIIGKRGDLKLYSILHEGPFDPKAQFYRAIASGRTREEMKRKAVFRLFHQWENVFYEKEKED